MLCIKSYEYSNQKVYQAENVFLQFPDLILFYNWRSFNSGFKLDLQLWFIESNNLFEPKHYFSSNKSTKIPTFSVSNIVHILW